MAHLAPISPSSSFPRSCPPHETPSETGLRGLDHSITSFSATVQQHSCKVTQQTQAAKHLTTDGNSRDFYWVSSLGSANLKEPTLSTPTPLFILLQRVFIIQPQVLFWLTSEVKKKKKTFSKIKNVVFIAFAKNSETTLWVHWLDCRTTLLNGGERKVRI